MKLFKKALAAVLAGVMALSMVACAPTTDPTKPDEPTTPVADAAATEVMKWLNYDIEVNNAKVGTKDEYGVVSTATKKELVKNDSTLVAKAEVVLEAMASDKADWSKAPGKIYVSQALLTETLNKKNLTLDYFNHVCVVASTSGNKGLDWAKNGNKLAYSDGFVDMIFDQAAFTYDMTGAKAKDLAAWGFNHAGKKVGVASKTINGKVYLVVVYEG